MGEALGLAGPAAHRCTTVRPHWLISHSRERMTIMIRRASDAPASASCRLLYGPAIIRTSNCGAPVNDQWSVATPFRIDPVRTKPELRAVKDLFQAYAASLPIDLDYQDFGFELADLPGKYAPPEGELLVAWDKFDRWIGCVGLRPLRNAYSCEMKRLYVVPQARSLGLGKALTEAIVAVARGQGYSELLLDTLSTMETASSLYQQMGFERIGAYYEPTPPGTIFMKLCLEGPQSVDVS